jgi:hypothetical protein
MIPLKRAVSSLTITKAASAQADISAHFSQQLPLTLQNDQGMELWIGVREGKSMECQWELDKLLTQSDFQFCFSFDVWFVSSNGLQ